MARLSRTREELPRGRLLLTVISSSCRINVSAESQAELAVSQMANVITISRNYLTPHSWQFYPTGILCDTIPGKWKF